MVKVSNYINRSWANTAHTWQGTRYIPDGVYEDGIRSKWWLTEERKVIWVKYMYNVTKYQEGFTGKARQQKNHLHPLTLDKVKDTYLMAMKMESGLNGDWWKKERLFESNTCITSQNIKKDSLVRHMNRKNISTNIIQVNAMIVIESDFRNSNHNLWFLLMRLCFAFDPDHWIMISLKLMFLT